MLENENDDASANNLLLHRMNNNECRVNYKKYFPRSVEHE